MGNLTGYSCFFTSIGIPSGRTSRRELWGECRLHSSVLVNSPQMLLLLLLDVCYANSCIKTSCGESSVKCLKALQVSSRVMHSNGLNWNWEIEEKLYMYPKW